ncbi:hypothetical protein MHLP_03165 [Candidatus Mycoplasma haematolamae str. Purdue]|uniref:Uncharacterized protein n=1 Tax=Mycoplasma haematolamae (strain Purdue) TaxID=1212765 RepID=I7BK15_MYCHA|nr:hypothetical protein [Candidatus Mycoplasma haematolamae]AFO52213.1 hypothetical protein MHLP_03165 [Candidatus Mycoplasma haematolamae str. Purdue]
MAFLSGWRSLSLLGLTVAPATAISYFATNGWGSKPSISSGLFTNVKLFIDSSNISKSLTEKTQGPLIKSRIDSHEVNRVSEEVQNHHYSGQLNLALIVELPLKNLGNKSHYRFCLPDSSLLKNNRGEKVSFDPYEAFSKICKLDYWSFRAKPEKEIDRDLLVYLLDLIYKFLHLQHAVNMIFLFHSEPKAYEKDPSHESTYTSLMRICGLDTSSRKTQMKDLLLSSNPFRKCYLPPKEVEVTLTPWDSKPNTEPISKEKEDSALTLEEQIKAGSLTGRITYGVFDFWGKPKALGDKKVSVDFTFPIEYALQESSYSPKKHRSSNRIDLETLYQKLQAQDLKLSDFNTKPL